MKLSTTELISYLKYEVFQQHLCMNISHDQKQIAVMALDLILAVEKGSKFIVTYPYPNQLEVNYIKESQK